MLSGFFKENLDGNMNGETCFYIIENNRLAIFGTQPYRLKFTQVLGKIEKSKKDDMDILTKGMKDLKLNNNGSTESKTATATTTTVSSATKKEVWTIKMFEPLNSSLFAMVIQTSEPLSPSASTASVAAQIPTSAYDANAMAIKRAEQQLKVLQIWDQHYKKITSKIYLPDVILGIRICFGGLAIIIKNKIMLYRFIPDQDMSTHPLDCIDTCINGPHNLVCDLKSTFVSDSAESATAASTTTSKHLLLTLACPDAVLNGSIRVTKYVISTVSTNPMTNLPLGSSILDVLKQQQTRQTSVNANANLNVANLNSNFMLHPHKSHPLKIISLNDSSTLLACASTEGTIIYVYDLLTKELLFRFRRGQEQNEIQNLVFDKQSRFLAASSLINRNTIHLFSLQTQEFLQKKKTSETNAKDAKVDSNATLAITMTNDEPTTIENTSSLFSMLGSFSNYFNDTWSFLKYNFPQATVTRLFENLHQNKLMFLDEPNNIDVPDSANANVSSVKSDTTNVKSEDTSANANSTMPSLAVLNADGMYFCVQCDVKRNVSTQKCCDLVFQKIDQS